MILVRKSLALLTALSAITCMGFTSSVLAQDEEVQALVVDSGHSGPGNSAQDNECRSILNEINQLENQLNRLENEVNATENRLEANANKMEAARKPLANLDSEKHQRQIRRIQLRLKEIARDRKSLTVDRARLRQESHATRARIQRLQKEYFICSKGHK